MPDRAERILHLALARGLSIGVAESLTGGLLTSRLVAAPGASAVVRGGIVAYSADLKVELLHVSSELIGRAGVVSVPVATAMARGVREATGADIGVATTGVAGPESHGGRPPGDYVVAVSIGDSDLAADLHAEGSRDAVALAAVSAALDLLLEALGPS